MPDSHGELHGRVGDRRSEAGFSGLEMVIALAIIAIMFVGFGSILNLQTAATGQSTDAYQVFSQAEKARRRIWSEMRSAVQDPDGLTATPLYTATAASYTFRTPVKHIAKTDSDYNTQKAAGLVSSNDILYAPYAKTIAYDAVAMTLTLTVSGAAPAGMKTTEVLATDVAEFAFFDGQDQTATPRDPDESTWVIGFRIVIERPSAVPGARGALVRSNPAAGVVLTSKVLVQPESLINSRTKGAPIVSPTS